VNLEVREHYPSLTPMEYLCDNARHLICLPYSLDNLHAMARQLGIKKCWFHKDHYDIPKRRVAEITAQCRVVSSKEIVNVIRTHQDPAGSRNGGHAG
jgi:hypothetical protein